MSREPIKSIESLVKRSDPYATSEVKPLVPVCLKGCPHFVEMNSKTRLDMVSIIRLCDRLAGRLYAEYEKTIEKVGPQLSVHVLYVIDACEASGEDIEMSDSRGEAAPLELLQVPGHYWAEYPLRNVSRHGRLAVRTRSGRYSALAPHGLWREMARSVWAHPNSENRILQIHLSSGTCRAMLSEEKALRRQSYSRAEIRGMRDVLDMLKPGLATVAETNSFLSVYGIVPWH